MHQVKPSAHSYFAMVKSLRPKALSNDLMLFTANCLISLKVKFVSLGDWRRSKPENAFDTLGAKSYDW